MKEYMDWYHRDEWIDERRKREEDKYYDPLKRLNYLENMIHSQENLIHTLMGRVKDLERQVRDLDWIKKVTETGE